MKKITTRILSLVLSLVMMASVLSVYASAATATTVKQYKKYLQLGDSISAGFGLKDYNRRLKGSQIIINNGTKLKCQTRISGSYADLLARDVQATTMYPYACPGFRSSEVRLLVDPDYTGDWVTRSKAIEELSMGAYNYKTILSWKASYQNAVKNADLITLDFGMNDTWFSTVAAVLEISYALSGEDVDDVLKDALDKFGTWDAVMDAFGTGLEKILQYPALIALLADGVYKFWVDFYINYQAIVESIYELNPDVTVVSVGCYNSFKDWELPIWTVIQPVYSVMNAWKQSFADTYSNYYYADVSKTEVIGTHTTLPLPQNLSLDDSGYNPHPTANGHKYMEQQILSVLPVGKRSSTTSTGYRALIKIDGTWAVRKSDGKTIDTSYTGLATNENGTYYVKNGVYSKSTNGIVSCNGGKFYLKSGKLQDTYTGIVSTSSTSYYVKDGKVQTSYTGLVNASNKKYYVKSGVVQTSYTGIVSTSSASYYVKNGVVDTSYSGTISSSSKTYTVKNGVVTSVKSK